MNYLIYMKTSQHFRCFNTVYDFDLCDFVLFYILNKHQIYTEKKYINKMFFLSYNFKECCMFFKGNSKVVVLEMVLN